jgi:hypothetical protein
MGYYSNFSFYIRDAVVNVKETEALEKFFANSENHENISGFLNVLFDVEDNEIEFSELCDITVEDNYAKFYDDRLFANKLSTVLVDGYIELYFVGEDGDGWGYHITPNKVNDMITKWVILDDDEPESEYIC